MTNYIGKSIKRLEDKRFITGQGKYTDDIKIPGMVHAYILRSPYAHAHVKNIDTAEALKVPGVVSILTGADIPEAIAGVPCGWQVDFKNGDTMKEPPHPLLVRGTVRHVGDGVAVVIADTKAIAKDASDLIDVDYDVMDAVADPKKAAQDGAPLVHPDCPNNLCFDWELGNPKDEVTAALAGAHHVTELDFVNQRVVPNAMETRGVVAQYDTAYDKYTIYTSTQNPHLIRLLMCAFAVSYTHLTLPTTPYV